MMTLCEWEGTVLQVQLFFYQIESSDSEHVQAGRRVADWSSAWASEMHPVANHCGYQRINRLIISSFHPDPFNMRCRYLLCGEASAIVAFPQIIDFQIDFFLNVENAAKGSFEKKLNIAFSFRRRPIDAQSMAIQ